MIRLKPIKPKADPFNLRKIEAAVREGMEEAADETKSMLERTTSSWQNQPTFTIEQQSDGFTVGTNDPIYGYVDEGTKPHIITPKRARRLVFNVGGRAKTAPNVIGSTSGARGDTRVFAKMVRHPGTKPRNFTKIVQRQIQGQIPVIIAAKLGGAVGSE